MENKKTAVFGIFTTVAGADLATDSLVKSGFSASDISALLPENLGPKPIATEKATKAHAGGTADEIKRAKQILKNTNAEDISSTGESSADVKADDRQVRRTTSGGSR